MSELEDVIGPEVMIESCGLLDEPKVATSIRDAIDARIPWRDILKALIRKNLEEFLDWVKEQLLAARK